MSGKLIRTCVCSFAVSLVVPCCADTNLLTNHGLEEGTFGWTDRYCSIYKMNPIIRPIGTQAV